MTDEEEIPLDGNTGDDLQKPHKHISLGFCRKQQVKETIINEILVCLFLTNTEHNNVSIYLIKPYFRCVAPALFGIVINATNFRFFFLFSPINKFQ